MSETHGRKLKVCIDLERCHGHARCLQEAPEVFGYGDTTNQAYVLAGANLEANRKSIDLAIDSCPERAISWATDAPSSSKGSGS
jgi:ferredoxin